MKFIKILFSALFVALSPMATLAEVEDFSMEALTPELMEDKNYTEFWQQVFLFEDGTFITSEFLVANFGFSTHHGILLSTLIRPNGDRFIIKNGRTRSGWEYNTDPFSLRIYQHSLNKTDGGYDLNLNNTMAQVNLKLTEEAEPWSVERLTGKKKAWQDVDFFAPALKAEGFWTPDEETDLESEYNTKIPLKGGVGFALHGVQSDNFHELMTNWLKVFGYGDKDKQKPFISHVEATNGGDKSSFLLTLPTGGNEVFEDVSFKTLETQIIEDSDVPYIIEVRAKKGNKTLKGQIELDDKLETFILNDHLNALEAVAASSQPKLKRFRFKAQYSFSVEENGETTNIDGEALSEYIDVIPPKGIRRRRSR